MVWSNWQKTRHFPGIIFSWPTRSALRCCFPTRIPTSPASPTPCARIGRSPSQLQLLGWSCRELGGKGNSRPSQLRWCAAESALSSSGSAASPAAAALLRRAEGAEPDWNHTFASPSLLARLSAELPLGG
ncbi:hypothetical protein AOLI_G00218430 [Acnodon oligacanthus]